MRLLTRLFRLVWGSEVDRALRPVLAVSFVGSVAGSTSWVFMGIWAKTHLHASDTQLGVMYHGLPPRGQTDDYLFKHGPYPGDKYATDGRYPNMTSADLDVSGAQAVFDPTTGSPIVTFQFTAQGDRIFKQVTQNEAARGSIAGLGANCTTLCAFAIVLDGELRSWPAVDPQQLPNGIDPTGTGAEVTGLVSSSEAKSLALELQSGGVTYEWFVNSIKAVGG